MKKNLFVLLSIATIIIAGCTETEEVKINEENTTPEELSLVEQTFNAQLDETQYIQDFEDFISYNVLSITEDKPYTSDFSFSAKFDKKSTLQWWVEFSQKKISKSHDLEAADIEFDIKAEEEDNPEPFNLSWSVTVLYKGNDMYANLHRFDVFMGEWNMTAKMYSLLWGMIIDKRVDMEAQSGWIITADEQWDTKLPYVVWTIKNVLETKNIQSSPDFLNSVAEMIDIINLHIDLWISANELNIIDYEIAYSELWDKNIQKEFTGSFQWKDSAFDLSFIVSQKWLDVHLYNIREYDSDINEFKDIDSEFLFVLQESKKSDYSAVFQSTKYHQKVIDLQWKIKYSNDVKFSADFVLEPLEIISWQKISWEIKWNIKKENLNGKENFPELSWEIMSINEILSTL